MKDQGFTLIETLIYLAIFSFIVASIFGVTWVLIPNSVLIKEKILYQRDLLYAYQFIESQIDRFDMDDYAVYEGALVLRKNNEKLVLIPQKAQVTNFEFEITAENEKYTLITIYITSSYGTSTYSITQNKE